MKLTIMTHIAELVVLDRIKCVRMVSDVFPMELKQVPYGCVCMHAYMRARTPVCVYVCVCVCVHKQHGFDSGTTITRQPWRS